MKHFTVSLLLGANVQLCITSSARSYNHGHPLPINTKTHSQGQPEPHKIHKRQGNSNQDELCEMVVKDESCTGGYFQAFANLHQRCNYSHEAFYVQVLCTPNSRGGYCTEHTYYFESNAERVCNSSSSSCSQECRNALIVGRYELGCCIQRFYNDSSVPSHYRPDLFSYSLWSNCGVEPITQHCPPSTITLPQTQIDPTCNVYDDSFSRLFSSTLCTYQYRDSTRIY